MKRISLSIFCGILFPILYIFLVGSICEFIFPTYSLDTMQVYGEPSMGLILAPIAVPVWVYDFIRFNQYFGLRNFFDTIWFRVFWMVGFNISIYSFLSYFLFWYFDLFKRSNTISYQDPPSPPEF
jgi:hypothetical protein